MNVNNILLLNCKTYSTTADKCTACNSGYKLSGNSCVEDFDCSGTYFMKIGNLCVTKYNMGDSTSTGIPTAAGVKTVTSNAACSGNCCYKGTTTGTSCTNSNGDYSGCRRTVCNGSAAIAICANFTAGGKTWRLPTGSDVSDWGANTYGKGSNGLMLCVNGEYRLGGYSRCDTLEQICYYSGYYGNCAPSRVWLDGGRNGYYFDTEMGRWFSDYSLSGNQFSVRCVTDI